MISPLTQKILLSKKYKTIYPPLVDRLVDEASKKYPFKEVEKTVKTKLHQIYGSFQQLNTEKLIKDIPEHITQEYLKKILSYHTSTNERLLDLDTMYQQIFELTGDPKIILDVACGLNPLTLRWMNLDSDSFYEAFDIDLNLTAYINAIISKQKIAAKVNITTNDVFTFDFSKKYDLILIFKGLQTFEQQEKGFTKKLFETAKANYYAISFPNGSLTGKSKNMRQFYKDFLYSNLVKGMYVVDTINLSHETLYIIKTGEF